MDDSTAVDEGEPHTADGARKEIGGDNGGDGGTGVGIDHGDDTGEDLPDTGTSSIRIRHRRSR
ncbi:hypothetical protein [Phytoactinopolyspora halotolerans]|uniref:Uncharacterized protein n=1 Tax=Phytoactinopolyspora halotolerans TaxID=1981512 RepID=A0A6L9SC66_9ACTN|nr:hypothetical protein [Phytoactinopolyspora halotolerans]NEE01610.1 hypothetical protein [Phytoactinopolyspora halotolerans]